MGRAVKRNGRRGSAPWIFLLFLILIAAGITVTEQGMNYMLGRREFKSFIRVGRTPDGQINCTIMGKSHHGPHIAWLARADSTETPGIGKGGPQGPRPAKKNWLTGVNRFLSEVRQVGRDVRRFFSTWQVDASLQDL